MRELTILKQQPPFAGIRTFMKLPHTNDLENVDFAVIGVPFDTGAGYAVGTRFGPAAIREMSQRLRPINPALNMIDLSKYMNGIDYGDLTVHPGYIEYSYEEIEAQLEPIFEKGIIPILLGGDHSVSLPHIRAAAKKYGPVSLVHFDAHSDTWRSDDPKKKYSHANMFSLGADEGVIDPNTSIQMGMRGGGPNPDFESSIALGYEVLSTDDVKKLTVYELCEKVKQRVKSRPVFLTFDVDFLDPVYAPGTGTPEVGGFTTYEAMQMIRGICGINIIGFDIVETLPDRDPAKVTALNAATITHQVLSIIAMKKRAEIEAVV